MKKTAPGRLALMPALRSCECGLIGEQNALKRPTIWASLLFEVFVFASNLPYFSHIAFISPSSSVQNGSEQKRLEWQVIKQT